jgi:hypothetical protein
MQDCVVINRPQLGYASAPRLAEEITKRQDTRCGHATLRQGDIAPPAHTYIRWGSTHSLSNKDATVLNSAKAIHRGSSKRDFRLMCGALSPETWTDAEAVPDEALEAGVVVRSARHAGGNNFWLVHNRGRLIAACIEAGVGFYISRYIKKTREFRVHCVQGRVVGVSEKHPADPDEPVWNYHPEEGDQQWTNFKWGDWPMDVVRFALAAFAKSRLHFGAVDVMHDGERPYVLEVNSAPTLSPYRASCYGRAIAHSMENNRLKVGEYEYARPLEVKDWKAAIHPGLME